MTDSIVSLPIPATQEIRTVSWMCGNLIPGDLCEHSPAAFVEEREGRWIRSWYVRTWTVPIVEGATYVRRYRSDRADEKSRWAVVRGGTLVELDRTAMEDLLDPENAAARAAYQRQREHERRYAVSRAHGTGMEVGVYKVDKSDNHIIVVKATVKEYRWRHATPDEIAEYKASLETVMPSKKRDGVRL